MIIEKTLKAPPDVVDSLEKDAERVESFMRSKKMRLSDSKAEKIEKDIDTKVRAWHDHTNSMRRRLVRYNDLLEGVVEETNFPFEGSSNITLHYAAGICRTFRSSFNKTMYQDEELAVPVIDPTLSIDRTNFENLQDGFNHTFSSTYNGVDILKDSTIPCLRDGTVVVSGSWERRLERAIDQRCYKTPAEFMKDYPDAESAGLDEDEYKGLLDQFILNPEAEIYISFYYDFVEFDGIEYKINSFANFVFFPTFARMIRNMELYGNQYKASESEIRIKRKRGEFYERGTDKILKQKGEQAFDEWDRARTSIEGINETGDDYKPYRLMDLVYKADLDEDGIPEKYLVCFAPDAKALMSMQPYPIRRNIDICIAFRMVSRDNRFPGVSLVGDCEDMFDQIDLLHRHRNNIRMLTTSPVFVAKKDYKELIDMGRAENVIRPGLTLWVDDIETSIKQLPIQNLDQPGNSMDEEQSLMRYVELVFGPTQGLSGAQTPDDPRAPARKTQMMLMQANARIDDYMDEYRKSLPDLFDLHAALIYQYSQSRQMEIDRGDNKVFKFPIDMLKDHRIKWKPKRRSVQLTPEFAMARMANLMGIYTQLLPLLQQGDPKAVEMWNRQVVNSGEPEAEKLIIDEQQVQAMAQQQRATMLSNLQEQMKFKAQGKGQEKMATEVGKHMGSKMSEAAMGPHGMTKSGQDQLAGSVGA